ncbi:MAG: 3-methyladenine DNA glycosylase, partial [Anaerolineaceae bacterium]
MKSTILERNFYLQPVIEVARTLIGKQLVRRIGENFIS